MRFVSASGDHVKFVRERGSGSEPGEHRETRCMKSVDGLQFAGIVWAYGVTPWICPWYGISPVYRRTAHTIGQDLAHKTLYSSVRWTTTPPPENFILRPTPPVQTCDALLSACCMNEDAHGSLPVDIVSIKVYHDIFVRGITLSYSNGQDFHIGDEDADYMRLDLNGEVITSLEIHERVRSLFTSPIAIMEAVCTSAIRVFTTSKDSQKQQEWPLMGTAGKTYPSNEERQRLDQLDQDDGADWDTCYPEQTRTLGIEPGTSFAGFYAECRPVSHMDRS